MKIRITNITAKEYDSVVEAIVSALNNTHSVRVGKKSTNVGTIRIIQ